MAEPELSEPDLSGGRRNPAPGVLHIPHEQTLVFLTVNAVRPARWLSAEEPHRLLMETWQAARGWLVGYYLLMPDHLHCICAPGEGDFGMERWISYWKDRFWKRHRRADWEWQPRGFHHRLRSNESFAEKWNYVRQNPVRAGLVERAGDWPWQGVVHDLGMVDLNGR